MNHDYYIIPDIEALPSSSGEERLRLIRRIAAAIGDPVALRAIIGIDPREFLDFYPDMTAPELTTEETIDSFLDRFAPGARTASGTSAERPADEELIYAPAVPYDIAALEQLPELVSEPLLAGIPAELQTKPADKTPLAPPPETQQPEDAEKVTSEPIFSESLAKIMIKNGNYNKALEIITEISLNNPKKSVYFADQIRFLKKLIKYTQI